MQDPNCFRRKEKPFNKVLVVPLLRLGNSSATITMTAIRQATEWLRPLLLYIPNSRPRPTDKTVSADSMRKGIGESDSSDEENGGNRGVSR